MTTHYPALIRKDADSDYGVEFPDFPGCVSAGRTLDEALAMAERALELHVEGMRDDDETIPEPSDLDAVLAADAADEAAVVLVALRPVKGRAVRFNATMDEFLLARIDGAAAERGMTRSGLLATAARQYVDAPAEATVLAPKQASGLRRGASPG